MIDVPSYLAALLESAVVSAVLGWAAFCLVPEIARRRKASPRKDKAGPR